MLQAYPFDLIPLENGAVMAKFVDLPAATQGDDEELAIHWAPDALHVALTGYIDDREDLPQPSRPKRGQHVAYLPPLVAMKLELYQAMRHAKVSRVQLAERLGIDEKQVRRLLDLDHGSRVEQLELALKHLGRSLIVDTREVATAS